MKKKVQKTKVNEVEDLQIKLDGLYEKIDFYIKERHEMKEKEIGYRAVISYLENQLGLKDSMT
jgi:hypothetical protein